MKKIMTIGWAMLVPVLLAVGCTTTETSKGFEYPLDIAQVGADPAKAAEIDALLKSFVEEKKTNSVAAFVARDGKVLYSEAFGWKDMKAGVPASVDDYYALFSQTKAVTTVAFMTLVEKGLVDIHDPVSKYFPGIPDQVITELHDDGRYETRPVETPMTFVHLMAHTAGFDAHLAGELRKQHSGEPMGFLGFGGKEPDFVPIGQHTSGGDFSAEYLEEEMLALAEYPLGFDPGAEWHYHLSTNMLGYLIERISGQPLRDYVKENVLDPLGMDDTDWFHAPEDFDRFVKPYRAIDGELVPGTELYIKGAVTEQQTYAEGAIGLNGPIEDYAKFCQMLLNKGEFNGQRILEPETVELMTTVNRLPQASQPFEFGLGFELYNDEKEPVPAVSDSAYAWGGLLGTAYIIDPDKNMIALFYRNMYEREELYPQFLEKAYELIE
ncbi:CubicO group peptidase (beta-lactamase class C family) [Marinimicrobium koreense]|uniref:CubicO group peptidase (Beta-lactamase class C family) n=2 Tax=Marinimicrobium koreense TaxID=306545 RepID=A0A3N1NVH2_9GAMM|nr:CubicO group peptidase (beta-lactamase class C family) [Marinimicrobium koreense]